MTDYTLTLNSTNDKMISKTVHVIPGSNTTNVTLGSSDDLNENQLYSYYVSVSNAVGTVSSDIKVLCK